MWQYLRKLQLQVTIFFKYWLNTREYYHNTYGYCHNTGEYWAGEYTLGQFDNQKTQWVGNTVNNTTTNRQTEALFCRQICCSFLVLFGSTRIFPLFSGVESSPLPHPSFFVIYLFSFSLKHISLKMVLQKISTNVQYTIASIVLQINVNRIWWNPVLK